MIDSETKWMNWYQLIKLISFHFSNYRLLKLETAQIVFNNMQLFRSRDATHHSLAHLVLSSSFSDPLDSDDDLCFLPQDREIRACLSPSDLLKNGERNTGFSENWRKQEYACRKKLQMNIKINLNFCDSTTNLNMFVQIQCWLEHILGFRFQLRSKSNASQFTEQEIQTGTFILFNFMLK